MLPDLGPEGPGGWILLQRMGKAEGSCRESMQVDLGVGYARMQSG